MSSKCMLSSEDIVLEVSSVPSVTSTCTGDVVQCLKFMLTVGDWMGAFVSQYVRTVYGISSRYIEVIGVCISKVRLLIYWK